MRSIITEHYMSKLQNKIFSKLKQISELHENIGRLCAIPVSLMDVGLESAKIPLKAIEFLALALLNLFGAAFYAKCSIKDAIYNTEGFLVNIKVIPIVIFFAPIKLIYQLFAIAINPRKAESIDYFPYQKEDEEIPLITCTAF